MKQQIALPESQLLPPHTPLPEHPCRDSPENLPSKHFHVTRSSGDIAPQRHRAPLKQPAKRIPPGSCPPPSHQLSVGLVMMKIIVMTSSTVGISKCLWDVSYIMNSVFLRIHLGVCLPFLNDSFHSCDGVFDQGNYKCHAIQSVSHSGIGIAHW